MANSNPTLQQQAYEYVRKNIFNLGYKPGEYITDIQIATQLNVSRTPVREAFHRLEKEGLLINEARQGWRVYSLSLNDIHEIFDLKEAIESMIARKAANCQDGELRAALLDALHDMEAAESAGETEAWFEADLRLHEIIFIMAENNRASQIINNLNDQWHRVRAGFMAVLLGRMRRSVEEHREFVESILEGKGDEAALQMSLHLNQVREELIHLLVTMVLPFAEDGV